MDSFFLGVDACQPPALLSVGSGQTETESPLLHLKLLTGDLGVILDQPAAFWMLCRELGQTVSQVRILSTDMDDLLSLVKPYCRFLLCFFQPCFQMYRPFIIFYRLKNREILDFVAGEPSSD